MALNLTTSEGLIVDVSDNGTSVGLGSDDVYVHDLTLNSREEVDALIETLQQIRGHVRTRAQCEEYHRQWRQEQERLTELARREWKPKPKSDEQLRLERLYGEGSPIVSASLRILGEK